MSLWAAAALTGGGPAADAMMKDVVEEELLDGDVRYSVYSSGERVEKYLRRRGQLYRGVPECMNHQKPPGTHNPRKRIGVSVNTHTTRLHP